MWISPWLLTGGGSLESLGPAAIDGGGSSGSYSAGKEGRD